MKISLGSTLHCRVAKKLQSDPRISSEIPRGIGGGAVLELT